tara:strand:+ start:41 stop:523 length:483 start_codon:yes stop_codon:yes gene_type:complete
MIKKVTKSAQIREYVAANPKAKSADVAKAIGVTTAYVATVMWTAKKKAKVAKKKAKEVKPFPIEMISVGSEVGGLTLTEVGNDKLRWVKNDAVNNPAHYTVGGIETIDFIEAKKLGYNLGNVVKYLTRADHKANKLQDLRKAQWYLEREIFNVENNKKTA